LNWKYKAEQALRLSKIPYTIIRPTGLVGGSGGEGTGTNISFTTRKIEAYQGDTIAGIDH
jgi:uncharacterized protein YbjT (DUF2867 family)